MRKILGLLLVSSFVLAGWTQEDDADMAAKAEAKRLCEIYSVKTQKYKETMRDDEHAHATLANYERLQRKYCAETSEDKNETK